MEFASPRISGCRSIRDSMGMRFPASHWARCSARMSAIRLFITVTVQAQFVADPVERPLVRLAHSFGGSSARIGNLLPTPTLATLLKDLFFRFSQTVLNLAEYLLVCHGLAGGLRICCECPPNARIAVASP